MPARGGRWLTSGNILIDMPELPALDIILCLQKVPSQGNYS